MRSGKICKTNISTVGKTKGAYARNGYRSGMVRIKWEIGDGGVYIDGVYYSPYDGKTKIWEVNVYQKSLEKTIKFLQKVLKEAKRKP